MKTYKQYIDLLEQIERKDKESQIRALAESQKALLHPYIGVQHDIQRRLMDKEHLSELLNDLNKAIALLQEDIEPRMKQLAQFSSLKSMQEAISAIKEDCWQNMTMATISEYDSTLAGLINQCNKASAECKNKSGEIKAIRGILARNKVIYQYFQQVNAEITDILIPAEQNLEKTALSTLQQLHKDLTIISLNLSNMKAKIDRCHDTFVAERLAPLEQYARNEMGMADIEMHSKKIKALDNEVSAAANQVQTNCFVSVVGGVMAVVGLVCLLHPVVLYVRYAHNLYFKEDFSAYRSYIIFGIIFGIIAGIVIYFNVKNWKEIISRIGCHKVKEALEYLNV